MLMSSLENLQWRIVIHIKSHTKLIYFFLLFDFFCRYKLVLVTIVFSTLNKVNE